MINFLSSQIICTSRKDILFCFSFLIAYDMLVLDHLENVERLLNFLVRLIKQRCHQHTAGSSKAYIQMDNFLTDSKYTRKVLTNVGSMGEPIATPSTFS